MLRVVLYTPRNQLSILTLAPYSMSHLSGQRVWVENWSITSPSRLAQLIYHDWWFWILTPAVSYTNKQLTLSLASHLSCCTMKWKCIGTVFCQLFVPQSQTRSKLGVTNLVLSYYSVFTVLQCLFLQCWYRSGGIAWRWGCPWAWDNDIYPKMEDCTSGGSVSCGAHHCSMSWRWGL